jgi:CDP-glucose 4,6-dehydratase
VEGVVRREFWAGRRVFIAGHTGFKGSWLSLWLQRLGAEVTGFALPPPTTPSLYEAVRVVEEITSIEGDVRDLEALARAVREARPEVVFHMAAQSLVRASYAQPAETYATNVMGTVHLLEAVRLAAGVRAVVVVTSDKCYENREWVWPYREDEPMGGKDPYSSSKGCAELVTAAYRASFFSGDDAPAVATVRAGNVIGGGDWANDRLVPDLMRAFADGRPAIIRYPSATRPWQFVLDALHGYVRLAELLYDDRAFADAWNFGPSDEEVYPVRWIAERLVEIWGAGAAWRTDNGTNPPEAYALKLDSSRARTLLGWKPAVSLGTALDWIVEWHRQWLRDPASAAPVTAAQIDRFERMLT